MVFIQIKLILNYMITTGFEQDDKKQQYKVGESMQLNQQLNFPEANSKQEHGQNYFQPIFMNKQNQETLLSSKIFYKKQKWAKEIVQNCLDTDFESSKIQLHYGMYATKITIINLQYKHNFQIDGSFIGEGQYGKVITCYLDQQVFVVKLINFSPQNFFENLKNIYQEYFIALMASQLRVGAKLVNLFGYSIVFFKNYALFGMQRCGRFDYKNQSIQSLKKCIHTLHSMHIVHRDIKLDNCLWSQIYQRYVLIDFGLSLIIRQIQGSKTLCSFAGSFNYCSSEMRKLFFLKSQGLVNMYENDRFAIQQCKKKIIYSLHQNFTLKNLNQKNQKKEFFSYLSIILRIKNAIALDKYQLAYSLLINCQETLKYTCFFITKKILERGSASKQFIVEKWQRLRNTLQQKIIKQKFVSSKIDEIITHILQKNNLGNSWSHLLLSEYHLKNFDRWSENQMWLQRIYFRLNPIIKQELNNKQDWQNSVQMINNIYKALKLPNTQILLKKVRSVLLFFGQKFKKFRKKNILKCLADFFWQIQDILNSFIIKDFILSITEDPMENTLLIMRYVFMDKGYSKLHCKLFYNYTEKVKKNMQNSIITENVKAYQIVKLIYQVVEKYSQISYQKLEEEVIQRLNIMKILQKIQKQIHHLNDFYSQIFFQAQTDFIKESQCTIKIHSNKIMYSNQLKIQMAKTKLFCLQATKQYLYCSSLSQTSLPFYRFILAASRRKLHQQNIDYMKEYISFILQINQEFISIKNYCSQVIKQVAKQKSIAYFVAVEQQKWFRLNKFKPSTEVIFQLHFLIQWNIKLLMMVLAHRDNGIQWLEIYHEAKFIEILQNLAQETSQIVQKYIENIEQKCHLYTKLRILYLGIKSYRICYTKEEQEDELRQQINKIGKDIIQNQFQIDNVKYQMELGHVLVSFALLVLLAQIQIFKNKANMQFLQNIITRLLRDYKCYQSAFHQFPNILKQFIKILCRRNLQIKIYPLLAFIAPQYDRKTRKYYYYQDINIHEGIVTFKNLISLQLANQYLTELQLQKQKLNYLIKGSYGCFLVFSLLDKVYKNDDKNQYIISQMMKIVKNIPSFQINIRYTMIIRYYQIFSQINQNKKRKHLINLLQYNRLCIIFFISYNKSQKLIRIVLKKSMRWPQNVYQIMKMKLSDISINI